MNAAEALRLRLQSLLARGLAAGAIASRVGLAAASEVWGGDEPRERPAWYLWRRGAAGAWQVELSGAGPLEGAGRRAVAGRFTVRRYPSPTDRALARFSAEERRVAAAALDATGTPSIELASAIPDALFTVGSIDWAVDLEGGAAVLALASLDRLRARDAGNVVVRDVPGWALAFPVFSLLAGLHAQVERTAASRLLLARQAGFELVASGAGAAHRDAPELAHGEAFLLFPPALGADRGAAEALLDALRDADAESVVDVPFEPGGRPPYRLVLADPRLPVPVSPGWFGGEAHRADRAMCAC